MKKTLHSLLTATSLFSTSFAANAAPQAVANSTHSNRTTPPVAIEESHSDTLYLGLKVPPLHFNNETKEFVGSSIKLTVGISHQITLRSEKGSLIVNIKDKEQHIDKEAMEGFFRELARMGIDPQKLHSQEDFYNALCAAVLTITEDRTISSSNLLKLRKVTSSVFADAPNSWKLGDLFRLYDHSREISEASLNKYHFASLTKTLKEKMKDFSVDEETLTLIAQKTFDNNITSPNCPNEIKSTFLAISEVLAIAAYHARTANKSPTTIFSESNFCTEPSALLGMLFELDDTNLANQELNILGATCSLPCFPPITDVQKEFAARWLNIVLSPSTIKTTALKITEQDGFELIPEIVGRAELLWDEYSKHVFGKTVSVVFARLEAACGSKKPEL